MYTSIHKTLTLIPPPSIPTKEIMSLVRKSNLTTMTWVLTCGSYFVGVAYHQLSQQVIM